MPYSFASTPTRGPSLNTSSLTLPHWRRAVGRVQRGTGQGRILCIGTSLTEGAGETNGAVGYPSVLAKILNSRGIPSQAGLTAVNTGQPDPRWVSAAPWASGNGVAQGWWANVGASYLATAAGAGLLTYTPGTLSNTFDVYYFSNNAGNQFTLNIDGGAGTTTTTATINTIVKATITTATPTTAHALNITATTIAGGGIWIIGAEAYNTVTPGILVANCGWSGSTALQWSNAAPAGYNAVSMIQKYAPDVLFIELEVNDLGANNATPAQIMSYLTPLISAGQASGDVILADQYAISPTENPGGSSPNYGTQVNAGIAATRTSKIGTGLPVYDVQNRFGAYTAWNAANVWSSDGLHLLNVGNADYAAGISQMLGIAD